MHVGMLTAPFANEDLDTVIKFASGAGFVSLEIACRPGTKHFDLGKDDPVQVAEKVRAAGLQISSYACYVNVTDGDPTAKQAARDQLKLALEACAKTDVDVLCCIAGLPPLGQEREQVIEQDAGPFFNELCRDAAADGIKVAMENWFATNIQHFGNWDQIFEVCPAENFGLNYDPSHLVWMGIDYLYGLDRYASRIFHTHAKDTEIRQDVLRHFGNQNRNHFRYVIPGFGVIDWGEYISRLRRTGYDGVLSIEHEDGAVGREAGFVQGLRYLNMFC